MKLADGEIGITEAARLIKTHPINLRKALEDGRIDIPYRKIPILVSYSKVNKTGTHKYIFKKKDVLGWVEDSYKNQRESDDR